MVLVVLVLLAVSLGSFVLLLVTPLALEPALAAISGLTATLAFVMIVACYLTGAAIT